MRRLLRVRRPRDVAVHAVSIERNVTPNFRDTGDCDCGCGEYGTRKKNGHVARKCKCRSCINRNNKRKGQRKQAKAAKRLGIQLNGLGGGNEENYGGALRIEVKADKRHAGPVHTAYQRTRAQSDEAKSIGDTRPFAFCAEPDGCSYGYIVIRTDDLENVVAALAENWGWT